MKNAEYIRVDHMIFVADKHGAIKREGKKREPVIYKQFQSINQAKKESHGMQKRLGDGTVRVQH